MSTAIFATKDYVDSHSGGGNTPIYLTTFYGKVATENGTAYIQGSAYSKNKIANPGISVLTTDAECVEFLKNFHNLTLGVSSLRAINIRGYYYPNGAPSPQYMEVVRLLSNTLTNKVTIQYMATNTTSIPTIQNDNLYSSTTESGVATLQVFTTQQLN